MFLFYKECLSRLGCLGEDFGVSGKEFEEEIR